MFGPIWYYFFQQQDAPPVDNTVKRLRIGKRRIVEKVRN